MSIYKELQLSVVIFSLLRSLFTQQSIYLSMRVIWYCQVNL